MDRRDMYKSHFRDDKSNQKQRRFASNQYRSINRATEYLSRRQIEVSPSPSSSTFTSNNQPDQQSTSNVTTRSKANLNSNNSCIKSAIEQKKLSYKERFKKWLQEKAQEKNALQELKKKQPKPFISTVRPNNDYFKPFNGLANEKNKFQFKKPLPPQPASAAKNGIEDKNKKTTKNRPNNVLKPLNGNGIRNNGGNKLNERLNIGTAQKSTGMKLNIPKLNQSYVTSTVKKSQQSGSSTASSSTVAIVTKGALPQSNGKPTTEMFIKENEEIISPIEKSEELNNFNGNEKITAVTNYDNIPQKSKQFAKHYRNLMNTEVGNLKGLHEKWEKFKFSNEKTNLSVVKKILIDEYIKSIQFLLNNKMEKISTLISEYETNRNKNNNEKLEDNLKRTWSEIELKLKAINLQNENLLQKLKIFNDDVKQKRENDGNDNNNHIELKRCNGKNGRSLSKPTKKRTKENKISKEKLKNTDFGKFMKKAEIDFIHKCLKDDESNKNAEIEEDPVITSLRHSVRLLDKRHLKDKLEQKKSGLLAKRLSTPKQTRVQKVAKQQQNVTRSRSSTPKQQEKANKGDDDDVERNNMDNGSKISLESIKVQIENLDLNKTNEMNSSTSSNATICKTPTRTASSPATNDDNEGPSNYVSPYVSLSRGKVSLKREMEKRSSLYKSDQEASSSPIVCDSIRIRHIKEAIKYFRNLITSETQRLNEICGKWESYQNNRNLQNDHDNHDNKTLIIEDNCNDMINVTIGQTKLLLNKKLKQFNDLIDKCEKYTIPQIRSEELKMDGKYKNDNVMPANNDGDNKLILPEDLEGFWSMVYLQVENIDKRFLNLDRWKENDWKDPDEIKMVSNDAKPSMKRKRTQQKRNKTAGNGGNNEVRKMLRAFKQNFKFNKKSNDDVIFISNPRENVNEVQTIEQHQDHQIYEQVIDNKNENENENHESTGIQKTDILPLTPLRRSIRLLNKSDNNNSIQKSTKHVRAQKVIEIDSHSRSNTPQKNMSPLAVSLSKTSTSSSAIKRNSKKNVKNPKSTSKKSKSLYNEDEIAYTPNNTLNKKSILKPPNSNVKGSVKRCVAFAEAEHIIKLDNINNELSGIHLLNTSADNNKYAFFEY